jgi:hypothetical protein
MVPAHFSSRRCGLRSRPRRRLRGRVGGVIGLVMACASLPAAAQEPIAPGGSAAPNRSPSAQVKQAKRLFAEGMYFFRKEDYERALSAFLRSRAVVPSVASTRNAAISLTHLGRDDEAVEMYEALLSEFGDTLGGPEKGEILSFTMLLRQKLGNVDLAVYLDGQVFIDGRERGNLPLSKPLWVMSGSRVLRIVVPGHRPIELPVNVPEGAMVRVRVPLVPLPQTPPTFAELFGGYAGGGTFGGDAVEECSEGCSPDGFAVGARVGYRLGLGGAPLHPSIALELMGGYLLVLARFPRTTTGSFTGGASFDVRYDLEDDLTLRGPFVGTGVSCRLRFGDRLAATARVTGGLLSAQSGDSISGTATTNGVRADVAVSAQGEVLRSQPLFLMPELGLNAIWSGFHAGVSLGIFIIPSGGPRFSHLETGAVSPGCGVVVGGECAPNSDIVANESAYGPLWILVPQIAVGHVF